MGGKGNKQHEIDMLNASWGSRWEVSQILGSGLGPRGFLDTNIKHEGVQGSVGILALQSHYCMLYGINDI